MVVDVEALRAENAAHRAENAALRVQLSGLVEQVAKLNERVSELLAVAQRKQRKPATPPAAAAPVELDGAAKLAFDDRPAPPPLPEKPAKQPRKVRPSGRKPLPTHLPVEDHTLRPEQCAQCGGTQLDVVDEVVEEKLHVVKEHQRRRVTKRTTCRCRTCLARTTPASLPAPYVGNDRSSSGSLLDLTSELALVRRTTSLVWDGWTTVLVTTDRR